MVARLINPERVLLYHPESDCAFWVKSRRHAERCLDQEPLLVQVDVTDRELYLKLAAQASHALIQQPHKASS